MSSPPSTSTDAGGRAVALGDDDDAPAVGEPALGVGERPRDVAAVGLGGVHAELRAVSRRRQLLVDGERAHRPPRHAQLAARGRGRRRCDRRDAAPRSIGASPPPAAAAQDASQELLAGGDQVVRRGVRTRSGSHDHGHGARRAARRPAAPCRRPAPAPATPCPRRRCPRRSCRASRPARGAPRRARAARARTSSVSSSSRHGGAHRPCSATSRRALVGDREGADLLDLVAPELHPQRVLLGRREDVEDAAAHRELAALLDQVDAGVRGRGQRVDDVVEVGRRRPARSATGSRSPRPLTCGCSTDADRARPPPASGPVAGSSAPGWASRRSTASRRPTVSLRGLSRSCGSVSQAGIVGDAVGGQQRAQRRGQVLGLAAGGGDREHGAPAPRGQRGDREGARRRRADQVDVHAVAVGGGLHRFGEGGVLDDDVEQTVQAHEGFPSRRVAEGVRAATRTARHVPTGRGSPAYDALRPGRRRRGAAGRPWDWRAASHGAPAPGQRRGSPPAAGSPAQGGAGAGALGGSRRRAACATVSVSPSRSRSVRSSARPGRPGAGRRAGRRRRSRRRP